MHKNFHELFEIGVALAMMCFFMTGCTLVKLKENVAESLASKVLVGQIAIAPLESGVIIVAAYSLKNGERKAAHDNVLHEAGDYELMVAEGSYFFCAYHDKNSNLVYDSGEPAGAPHWLTQRPEV